LGDLPDEARQLTRDRDGDRGALLRARCVQVRPAAVQPDLRAPGSVDRRWWLPGLAALERLGDSRCAPVVPGRLDEQPAGM
jgi:hypothetical protein